MARTLRYFGLALLAATAWILIAGQSAWISQELTDRLTDPGLKLGLGLLGLGLVVQLLSPVVRSVRGGRCVRCGVRIERGQAYCRDHLRR